MLANAAIGIASNGLPLRRLSFVFRVLVYTPGRGGLPSREDHAEAVYSFFFAIHRSSSVVVCISFASSEYSRHLTTVSSSIDVNANIDLDL